MHIRTAMNWDDMRIFLGVVGAGSMRAGAKALKISHSTISRRIEALEADVGARLFERRPDGFELTDAGKELVPVARAMEVQAQTFGRRAQSRDRSLSGTLKITMADFVSTYLMARHLFEFMSLYPDIRLEVAESMMSFDLSKREADIAIRFTNRPPEYLIGQKIGTAHQAAYCLPSYRAQYDPSAPDSTARWIGFGDRKRQAAWIAESPFPALEAVGRFDNIMLQIEAVRAGLGIGFLPCFVGHHADEFERLSEPQPMVDVWILSHRDLRATAKVKAFRRFVMSRRTEIASDLEGHSPV